MISHFISYDTKRVLPTYLSKIRNLSIYLNKGTPYLALLANTSSACGLYPGPFAVKGKGVSYYIH